MRRIQGLSLLWLRMLPMRSRGRSPAPPTSTLTSLTSNRAIKPRQPASTGTERATSSLETGEETAVKLREVEILHVANHAWFVGMGGIVTGKGTQITNHLPASKLPA